MVAAASGAGGGAAAPSLRVRFFGRACASAFVAGFGGFGGFCFGSA